MSASDVPADLRNADLFHHIDMGFLNRRLCLTALPRAVRTVYIERQKPGSDHMTVLGNDHLLVTVLLDVCHAMTAPTLLEALALGNQKQLFRSTERLSPCPEIYEAKRVSQRFELNIDFGKSVQVTYHTEHIVSSTGMMTLAEGSSGDYVESIVGILHDKDDRFDIEPLVMGAPWFDHPRNGDNEFLIWLGRDFGEILPEDIDQFSKMKFVQVANADEWLDAMKKISEKDVKDAFANLLGEPSKKDWGGESNDHFSSNLSIAGKRRSAAFLFKGPAQFREMTLDMCGNRADQVYRLTNSGADISIVQNSHLIGEAVRGTLRALTVFPGYPRKYCLIDGQATYRILKAYSLLAS
jgi:hypothetical protein